MPLQVIDSAEILAISVRKNAQKVYKSEDNLV